ncbi:MAG: amidohydrolase family protein [Dehalococcoidia bacterium]
MRSIDVHAHLVPQCLWRAINAGKDWYGAYYEKGEEGQDFLVVRGRRQGPERPKVKYTPEERIKDMDAIGTDVHVVSIAPPLFNYDLEPDLAVKAAQEVNDEIAGMAKRWPDRFSGLAALPLPDVKASVAELERAVTTLGLKGAEVDTRVNERNWDEPDFAPLFQVAEALGAVLFFHPARSLVWQRTSRYHLGNTIGNTLEDTMVIAALIFGGVLERHPNLKAVIAHGGGPACYGIGRMDRGWQVRSEARIHIQQPPSRYLRRLYYDCITWSEAALRFLIDTVGADRVVLGSDWPYDMGPDSPVQWLTSMQSITQEEKELILWKNLEQLLGI